MMAAGSPAGNRSIIYIDGFNLYHGALSNGPYKWLDLEAYFRRLRPHDDIQIIRYFTARMLGPKRVNQTTYLRVLETLPLVQTVVGRFKAKEVTCRVAACRHPGPRVYRTFEEKRTDVNIAVTLLDDAYAGLCDRQIIISGDSDLVPAVARVKTRFPDTTLIAYIPARNSLRGAAVELRSAVDRARTLPLQLLPHSQFPAQVPDGAGGVIQKPAGW